MSKSEDAESMWRLADQAVHQERQLPPEAESRRRLGEELRAARRYIVPSHVPGFRYPSPVRSGSTRALRWAFAGLGALVSVAFATLIVAPLFSRPDLRSHKPLPAASGEVSISTEAPVVRTESRPVESSNMQDRASAAKAVRPEAAGPRTVRLSKALRELARLSGIKLQIAPGMPDPKVNLDPSSDAPEVLLAQLALKNDFTIFDQGDGSILIIPAVDKKGGERWKSGASVAGTR